MVFGAYMLINIWQNNQNCASPTRRAKCYEVRDPLDLAVVAAARHGACFGFLWWNALAGARSSWATPARSALGGALAGPGHPDPHRAAAASSSAACSSSITLSVDDPGRAFGSRLTGNGHRVFRMAPLQHHFELLGWDEVTIVDPVLDHRRAVRRRRARRLLRRVGRRCRMSDPPTSSRAGLDRPRRRLGGLRVRRRRASASAASPPPTTCSSSAPRSSRSTSGRRPASDGEGRAPRASSAPTSGSAPAPPPPLPDGRRPAWSPRPGWRPDPPLLAQARARGIPVWGEVELAWRLRDPRARRALARRHRHQRQDHDRADARRDPAGGRAAQRRAPATSALPIVEAVMDPDAATTCSPSSCPASSCTTPTRCAPQAAAVPQRRRPTTSTGTTARSMATTPRTRAGSTSGVAAGLRLQRRRPRDRAAGRARPRWSRVPRDRLHPRHARRSAMVGVVDDVLADRAFVERAADQRRRARARSPTSRRRPAGAAQRRQRAGRGRPGPRPRRAARPRCATGCAPSGPTATASPRSPPSTA